MPRPERTFGVPSPSAWVGHRRVMTTEQPSNERSGSTTWAWKRVKISQRPQGPVSTSPEASLLPWDLKKPVTVTLKYRGGPEGWVEVRARNRTWRYPGTEAIHDVLLRCLGHHPR